MEVNGDSGPIDDMRTMQGETIPPMQSDFGGFDSGEPVFLIRGLSGLVGMLE